MDTSTPELDAMLDELFPGEEAAPPEEPASPEVPIASVEDAPVQPVVAVAETPPSAPVDAPLPDYAAQLDAMQAQLAQVSEKAGLLDRLQELALQRQAEEAERVQFAEWEARYEQAAELPDAQRQAEIRRIALEIKQHSLQPAQEQVVQSETLAEQAAKAASALYTILPNYLTPEQIEAAKADVSHLIQFQSPDAMQSQIARDKALIERGKALARAEIAKAQETGLVAQAQERIASDADLVGAGAGAPATGQPSIDDVIDALFQ